MRPGTAYFISAMVHVFALAAVGVLGVHESVQYQVAAGEPIIVQASQAVAEHQAPQPVKLVVETEIESAQPLPMEEFHPREHALTAQPVLVEREPSADVAEELARVEPKPAVQPNERLAQRTTAKPPPPETPEPPKPRPDRQVTTEIAAASTTAMQAQLAQQAGAKVDQLPIDLPANPEPPYPVDAWRVGAEGKVVLRVLIADSGFVERVTVEATSGWASFDDSALTTVRRWRFAPAKRAGAAVSLEVLLPVRFQLRRG